ncbi:D-2-hydroxyacid dehydrogenase [Aurantiacibacter luteus]|uniref:Dehydrogenase n=1 Tax=Aurantiacibacter luteus TaxID=1581420 RepID=A0A0G9MWZ2_9SPHN|nr:D-2-hydroxyacid dehydrogenase [Aurantiacibacter luteus]KLE35241.1 dehydrogenase [Aurantiacibacter luteus]
MEALIRAVLPEWARPGLEGRLPDWIDVAWWRDEAHLLSLAPSAEIGWFDMHDKAPALAAIAAAPRLRWLSSAYAGVDWMPLGELAERGVVLTCGAGLAANQVAEFAVMTMLGHARGYREIVRLQERHGWTRQPPGGRELMGSRALILGYGAIGQAIARILAGFGVDCVPVRSHAGKGVLGPDDWRGQLASFDWIVMTLPSTCETRAMLGAAEFAEMKPDAVVVNFGRAETIDQPALVAALEAGQVGGAILDLTDPEPLPPGHPLWALPNVQITMHLAGIPNAASRRRAADRFLTNCERFRRGEPLEAEVDLARGY